MLATTLTTKPVVGDDGREYGTVQDVTVDPDSGTLVDIVVDPQARLQFDSVAFDTDEHDRLLVPVECVQVVKDTIVVRP